MVNRTAFPGTATNTTHLASEDNSLPGGWIGYAEVVAAQLSITTLTDLTGLSQAVTVNTSRRIMITGQVMSQISATDTSAYLHIREASTTLHRVQVPAPTAGGGPSQEPRVWSVVLTPSGGSHTYKLSMERNAGTGTVGIAAANSAPDVNPAFILIVDLGPAS